MWLWKNGQRQASLLILQVEEANECRKKGKEMGTQSEHHRPTDVW